MSGSRRLFEKILSSDCKAELLILSYLRDLEDVGPLSKERDRGALKYNGRRAAEIQRMIAAHITTKLD